MKKMVKVLLVGFLVAALASQSLAWWGKGKPKKVDPDQRMQRIAEKLELTEAQKEKLISHKNGMRDQMIAHGKKMKELKDKFKAEFEKDNPSRKILHSLIRQMNDERVKMEIKRVDSLLELSDILTPEQKEKFKLMTKKHKRRGPKGSRRPR